MGIFQPPSEARWFTFWDRRSARPIIQPASVRGFFVEKLPQTMECLNETLREGSFGQDARDDVVAFLIGHQGAELLGAKGGKMGVLAVIGDFKAVWAPNRC